MTDPPRNEGTTAAESGPPAAPAAPAAGGGPLAGPVARAISRKIGRAIGDFRLIEDGDRILVALSGGKDSYTLLRMLAARRAFAPVRYALVAAHVHTDGHCGQCAQSPRALPDACAADGIELRVSETTVRLKPGEALNCHACATARRQALFRMARDVGANKLALGHHLDDIVETALLNLFFQGAFATMPPSLALFGGGLTIIRPLALVPEAEIVRYVDECVRFPRVSCACPVGHESQRRKMKALVQQLEAENPNVRQSVFGALANVKPEYLIRPAE
jgi:tRNA 2-thiocytidine biosynthesis protein TtcA